MKAFLPVMLLTILLAPPAWAEREPESADTADSEAGIVIDVETSGSEAARRDLGERIETRVRSVVREALENNPDITEEDLEAFDDRWDDEWDEEWVDLEFDEHGALGVGEALVAILAIILIFGSPVMLVAIFLYASYRKRRLVRDMISQYLANGQPVPPEVFKGLAGDVTPRSNLHKGMILLGVGIGVVLSFWLMGKMTVAYLGLIPLFIGAAQLLIWKLEKDKAGAGE